MPTNPLKRLIQNKKDRVKEIDVPGSEKARLLKEIEILKQQIEAQKQCQQKEKTLTAAAAKAANNAEVAAARFKKVIDDLEEEKEVMAQQHMNRLEEIKEEKNAKLTLLRGALRIRGVKDMHIEALLKEKITLEQLKEKYDK